MNFVPCRCGEQLYGDELHYSSYIGKNYYARGERLLLHLHFFMTLVVDCYNFQDYYNCVSNTFLSSYTSMSSFLLFCELYQRRTYVTIKYYNIYILSSITYCNVYSTLAAKFCMGYLFYGIFEFRPRFVNIVLVTKSLYGCTVPYFGSAKAVILFWDVCCDFMQGKVFERHLNCASILETLNRSLSKTFFFRLVRWPIDMNQYKGMDRANIEYVTSLRNV